ncbi:MAG: lactate utilization protein C [Alphaproteobacteria bacterium]
MTTSRQAIMDRIAAACAKQRNVDDATRRAELAARLKAHDANLIPQRGQLDLKGRIDLFAAMAGEAAASVSRVARAEGVPHAIADFLAKENLPASFVMAPDARLDEIPWRLRPMLQFRHGTAEADDAVSVTGAFLGVAETGTLMLESGESSPTKLNFMPDTHVVVLWSSQIVGAFEEGWAKLRASHATPDGGFVMPRNVNFITGPSRSADIEQTLQLGAHGPRRLHIVIVDETLG